MDEPIGVYLHNLVHLSLRHIGPSFESDQLRIKIINLLFQFDVLLVQVLLISGNAPWHHP